MTVFVDSVTGEAVGDSVSRLYYAGAKNVQVISTVTKKNRPGYMFVIDCSSENVDVVENVIVSELQATGWHRIQSDHCYIAVDVEDLDVVVSANGKSFTMTVQRKVSSAAPELVRPEYESCSELREKVKTICGISMSLPQAKAKIAQAFRSKDTLPQIIIEE